MCLTRYIHVVFIQHNQHKTSSEDRHQGSNVWCVFSAFRHSVPLSLTPCSSQRLPRATILDSIALECPAGLGTMHFKWPQPKEDLWLGAPHTGPTKRSRTCGIDRRTWGKIWIHSRMWGGICLGWSHMSHNDIKWTIYPYNGIYYVAWAWCLL